METVKTWLVYALLYGVRQFMEFSMGNQKNCLFLDALTPLFKTGYFSLI